MFGIFLYIWLKDTMDNQELIEELKFNDRWLSDEYKNSIEYREYLSIVFSQLVESTKEKY